MSTTAPAHVEPAVEPTILSFSRAYVSAAKDTKVWYWRAEAIATMLSIASSLTPWARVAALVGVLSVVAKVASKLILSAAKKLFRVGERQRRYDFYLRALGWPPPVSDRADLDLANSSARIRKAAEKRAADEADYFAHQGSPGKERLFCNLAEVMFWSERLFGAMAKILWTRFALAAVLVGTVLVATILVNVGETALLILKCLGSVVALLVTVDLLGEARSASRGETEIRQLLRVLETEMARPAPSQDEALRLLVEYNCLLADLPMIPDEVYGKNRVALNAAWKKYEPSLPFRCAVSANEDADKQT